MDRCTGHHDISEITLKVALNTIESKSTYNNPKKRNLLKTLLEKEKMMVTTNIFSFP